MNRETYESVGMNRQEFEDAITLSKGKSPHILEEKNNARLRKRLAKIAMCLAFVACFVLILALL